MSVGGAVTGATTGGILFTDSGNALAQDPTVLFWDDTNNRLGIGNAAPATALHVTGTVRASAGLTLDYLTAGRVPFAGASGAITDAAGMTYATASGLALLTDDATTNASLAMLTLSHTSSGTAAAGFGTGILFKAESAGGTLQSCVELDAVWTTATNNAELAALVIKAPNGSNSFIEIARFGAGSSTPQVDLSFSVGRCLFDSRSADIAYFSHQDRTATTDYAIFQNANGQTRVNAASGQTAGLYANNTLKLSVSTTGIGFFTTTPVAQQTGPALNITNSVTSGGTDGTIANYTDLTVYANDAATIRNDIYQLARGYKLVSDALRAYGLIT